MNDKEKKPAEYGFSFDIQSDPFDPKYWYVTLNGATVRVKVPPVYTEDK